MEHTAAADDATEGQGAGGGRDAARAGEGDRARPEVQGRTIGAGVGEVGGQADGVVRRERDVEARGIIEAEARAFEQVEDTRAERAGVVEAQAALTDDEASGERVGIPERGRVAAQLDEGVAAGEDRVDRLGIRRRVEVDRTIAAEVQGAGAADVARDRVGVARPVRRERGRRPRDAHRGKDGDVQVLADDRAAADRGVVDGHRTAAQAEEDVGIRGTDAPTGTQRQGAGVEIVGGEARGATDVDADEVRRDGTSVLVEEAVAIDAEVDAAHVFARERSRVGDL